MQLRPIVEGEVDHDKAGGRRFFFEAFVGFDVTRADQLPREIVQARIVADDKQSAGVVRTADKLVKPIRAGIVDAFVLHHARRLAQCDGDELPGFQGPRRRRNEREVGNEPVTRHVSADDRRVGAAPRHQLAITITLAGFGALGLGVAQQQQTTHRRSSLICPNILVPWFLSSYSVPANAHRTLAPQIHIKRCRPSLRERRNSRVMGEPNPTSAHGGSWYAATMVDAPQRPALTSDDDVDVCVIGGGLAGLTTAREIARAGWSVVVLAAGRIASGPSGRNTGFLWPGFAADADQIVGRVGFDRAKSLWALSQAGLDYVRGTIHSDGMAGIDSEEGWLYVSQMDTGGEIAPTGRLFGEL